MVYLGIVLFAGLLGGLIWWQRQQERQWLEELSFYQQKQKDSTIFAEHQIQHADYTENDNSHQETSVTHDNHVDDIHEVVPHYQELSPDEQKNEMPLEQDVSFPFQLVKEHEVITLADATRNLQAALLQPHNIPFVVKEKELSSQNDVVNEEKIAEVNTETTADATAIVAPQVISLEEATRHLNMPKIEVEPTIILAKECEEPVEEITLDDPALNLVRQRALAQLAEIEVFSPTEVVTQNEIQHQINDEITNLIDDSNHAEIPPMLPENETANPAQTLPEWRSNRPNLETIDINDIQASLAQQRAAWLYKQQLNAQQARHLSDLDVIADEEVWANLGYQSKPNLSKRVLPETSSNYSAPISGVAIAAPVIAPTPAITPPMSLAHPKQMSQASEFAASFFTNNTPQSPLTAKLPEKNNPNNESKDILTEEDFSQYYQEKMQSMHAVEDSVVWQTFLSDDIPHDDEPIAILPPLDLLKPPIHNHAAELSPDVLLENSIMIEEKLAEYKVKVKVLDAYAGPVITRYEIEPDVGVRGSSVINLEKDLARTLGVASIRVVETIPGKTCMGLELPNPQRQMIRLREIFASPEFSGSKSKLTLALGQDITGEPVVTDLAKAPHLLVAGTTGSGKSVGVNAMILSMLYKASPEEVRMIMIDPKMLELSIYEGIPHLLAPVVTDMKLAANALNWCVNEMEKRYRLMSHVGVRNLASYNDKILDAAKQGQKIANPFSLTPDDPEPLEKLPFIVVVVDEFADLMMTAGKQIEQLIARLAQKARAAGIHLILATQRPSVDVITGLIKANIPTRIAFQVSTKIDSRTILDQTGAENLLGQGEMLFLPPGTGYPQRVHGAFVADEEVHQVVEFLKRFIGTPDYIDEILSPEQEELGLGISGSDEKDPLFDQAVEVIIRTQKATISSLQRHLRIGYNKAATIIEQLEHEGIISTADHSGKRTILARKNTNE